MSIHQQIYYQVILSSGHLVDNQLGRHCASWKRPAADDTGLVTLYAYLYRLLKIKTKAEIILYECKLYS